MTYSYSNTPLYVSEGDYIQFKFKAPPAWDFTQTITVKIGDLTQFWLISTIPEDFTPDPFPLAPVDDAELDTMYTYADGSRPGENLIVVSGLTPTTAAPIQLSSNIFGDASKWSLRIDYDGDGTWDTGWIQTNGTQTVENGAKIQIRGTTSGFNGQVLRLNLVIGTSNEQWTVTNKPEPANEPVPFPVFTDLTDLTVNKYAYSEVIRIQGLNTAGLIATGGIGEWAVSSNNSTTTNGDGFDVLDNVTFTGSNGTIQNGDYLQLRIITPGTGNTPRQTSLSIGDISNGSTWTVTTGANLSTTPNAFSFTDVNNAAADALVGSDTQPAGGIAGLGAGTSVEATVVSTDASIVRVKVNNGSIGVFPASVTNGDQLTIYLQSDASFGASKELQIQVGTRVIPTWTVVTNSGPDTNAAFQPPQDRNNQAPDTFISSAPVAITGINQPITIECIGGYNALISIDFDTPVQGPRTFDPAVNSSFYLIIKSATQLSTPENTTISVGTGTVNNPFTWTVTTYAVAPPSAANLGKWYSNKTEKFDGYPVGTVLPVLKEGSSGTYGTIDGALGNRYAGFIACEGQILDANQYWALFDMIGNTYGGTGSKDTGTDNDGNITYTYTGTFNLPDYRNRRLCGIGLVNSSRGNSAFLPVTTSGKGINDPGAEGGYWYFDRVDSFGVQPLEQIQGPPTSDTGLNSQFFSLGTVRLSGLETIIDDVTFSISGLVTAQIGPLQEVTVAAPDHNHAFIAAQTENDGGEALISWGPPAGRGMFTTAYQNGPTTRPADTVSGGDNSAAEARAAWATWLNSLSQFRDELRLYYGNNFTLDDFVAAYLPQGYPVNEESGGGSTDFGPESDDQNVTVDFLTWWISPTSAYAGAILQPTGAGGGNDCAAVVDTQPTAFRFDPYTPVGGQTLTHSHLITENIVGNPNTDFTGGNVSGVGTTGAPFGSGLGGGVSGSLQTFQLWERRTIDSSLDEGRWTNRAINEWAYRLTNGDNYWTSVDDEVTIDCPMLYSPQDTGSQTGSGMILNITYTPFPSIGGGNPVGDTRYRVNLIVNAGQNYAAGDILTCQFWNDFGGSGDIMFRVQNVAPAGTGGAAPAIQVSFTQSDLFMDMTEGNFKFASNFKKPFPSVTMRPQRQVPILNPFHKTKYMIKAY